MKANKKKTTKKTRTARTKKPKEAKKKDREDSFAGFLDNQMIKGITWAELQELAGAEADLRGTTSNRTVGALKSHARFRASQDRWTVTMDDTKVKMARRQEKGGEV